MHFFAGRANYLGCTETALIYDVALLHDCKKFSLFLSCEDQQHGKKASASIHVGYENINKELKKEEDVGVRERSGRITNNKKNV